MRDDFPHLNADGANVFPDNAEPRPYIQYKNTFDYTKWNEGSIVKLMSVEWDGERDAPYFADTAARDKWMDDNAEVMVTLTVSANMKYDDIKLPIPYDVAQQYNYLVLTLPAYPVANEADSGTRTFCFYVRNTDYSAPNTTVFNLQVDWWTTYINKVNINRVMLRQGHWAVANSANVDTFLANPISNTSNLMDNEGDAFTSEKIQNVVKSYWNTGEMMMVFDTGGVDNTGNGRYSTTQVVYPWDSGSVSECYTTDADNAFHREVAGVVAPWKDFSFPTWDEPTTANPNPDFTAHDAGSTDIAYQRGFVNSETPGGAHFRYSEFGSPMPEMFAINASDIDTFMSGSIPFGFWETVRATYIIPTRYIRLDTPFEMAGVQCYPVIGAYNLTENVTLTKDDFAYPDVVRNWTKLYTGQYARIYITASDGRQISVPPETLGADTELETVMQITQDGVRLFYALQGVGTTNSLEMVRLTRANNDVVFGECGDWQKTLIAYDIPTYAVFQSQNNYHTWRNGPNREQARWDMWLKRDFAIKDANVSRFISDATAWQAYRNSLSTNQTVYDNAVAAAKTNVDNVTASAEAARANALSNAKTSYNTVNRNTQRSKDNLDKSIANNLETATTSLDAAQTIMQNNLQYQMYISGITPANGDTNGVNSMGTIDTTLTGSTAWKLVHDAQLDYNKFHSMNTLAVNQAVDGVGVTAINSVVGNTVNGAQNAATGFVEGFGRDRHANLSGALGNGAIDAGGAILGAAANVGVTAIGASYNMGLEISKISGTEDIQRDYVYGAGGNISATGGTDGKLNVEIAHLLASNWYQRRITSVNYNAQRAAQVANLSAADVTNKTINDDTCATQLGNAEGDMKLNSSTSLLGRDIGIRNAQRSRDLIIGGKADEVSFKSIAQNGPLSDTETVVKEPAWDYAGTAVKNKRNADDTSKSTWGRAFYNNQDSYYWRVYPDAIITAWNDNMRIRAGEVADGRGAAMMFGANTGENGGAEIMPQGVTVRVSTPLDGDVLRIADRFTRYGYVCHRLIDSPMLFEKWDEIHNYEYWQCDEVWITNNHSAPQIAVLNIKNMLKSGITVINMESE